MKTKNIKYLLSASLLCCGLCAAMTSCSNEDYLGGHVNTDGAGVKMNVTASISDYADASRTWQADDAISITAGYGQSDASARNREYVCGDDGKTFTNKNSYPMYVKGATDIMAYYPYGGVDGGEPSITLNTKDQDNITEYFFAKQTGVNRDNGGSINLAFTNALSRIDMTITAPDDESIRGYRLSGFSQVATVDPYTLGMELNAPEDLSGEGEDISSLSLQLIPQTIDADAAVPATLVLIGDIRSYSIDMSQVKLVAGQKQQINVDVTDGVGTIEFVPAGAEWHDSGLGGNVSAK